MNNDKPISEMTDQELWEEYENAKHYKTVFATSQLVKKILLNSLYGATGSPFYALYNKDVAQATTLCGQAFIRTVAKNMSIFIKKITNDTSSDPESLIAAGDTDSVASDTLLHIQHFDNSTETITIENFYNSVSDEQLVQDNKNENKFVKSVNNEKVLTIANDKMIYSPIKYIMKHKVKKRMYRLKINEKSITITEDHSLVCERDGKLIRIKPNELMKTDSIIYLSD